MIARQPGHANDRGVSDQNDTRGIEMTKSIVPFFILLMLTCLTGCVSMPNMQTGAGCWRYGVLEQGNTGPMSRADVEEIPVVYLSEDGVNAACTVGLEEWVNEDYRKQHTIYACFKPRPVDGKAGTDTIYIWWRGGKRALYEEKCHILLGRKHNACYGKYGIGKDESACKWVVWSAENAATQKRLDSYDK